MRKFLSKMAVGVMSVLCAVALVACGMGANTFITAKAEKVTLGGQDFQNASGFSVNYKGDNKYEAVGNASTMTAEQAEAYWAGTATEGDKYVVLSVKFDVGSKIVFGYEAEGNDFTNPDGTRVKQYTNTTDTDDTLDIILRLNTENSIYKVVETKKDAGNSTAYTINMEKINTK